MARVTKRQAEATLKAIRVQFAAHIAPVTIDGKEYPPSYPEPTLILDFDGRRVIAWEEGPYEWIHEVDRERMPAGVWVEPVNSCVLAIHPV